jgi:NhaP-type Na+/H+ or K+/H+ antiporter
MTVGIVLLEKSEKIAHDLSIMFSKLWVIAEIILFVIIGLYVDMDQAYAAGLRGLGVIAIGLLFRSAGVLFSTGFSRLSRRERLFCVAAYLPKATVQAAMGSLPLSYGIAGGEIMLTVAVLSIIVTSPLGLFLVRKLGPILLHVDFPDETRPRIDADEDRELERG